MGRKDRQTQEKKSEKLQKLEQKARLNPATSKLLFTPREMQARELRRRVAKAFTWLSYVLMLSGLASVYSGRARVAPALRVLLPFISTPLLNSRMLCGLLVRGFAGWIRYFDDPRMACFRIEAARRKEEEERRREDPSEIAAAAQERPCVLCRKMFLGFGHIAQPLKAGLCCDKCKLHVTRARADAACAEGDAFKAGHASDAPSLWSLLPTLNPITRIRLAGASGPATVKRR